MARQADAPEGRVVSEDAVTRIIAGILRETFTDWSDTYISTEAVDLKNMMYEYNWNQYPFNQ